MLPFFANRFRTTITILCLVTILLGVSQTFMGGYLSNILILTFTLAIFAASWDLIYGFCGQINFGPTFQYGMAAFVSIFLVRDAVSIWLSFFLGAIVAAGLGVLIAGPSLRLRPLYFAMVTFAMCIIANGVALILTGEEGANINARLFGGGIVTNYYFALVLMTVSIGLMHWIGQSRVGIKFKTIREDQIAAEAMGINTTNYKLLAFAISSFFAGVAGAYTALYIGHVDFNYFAINTVFQIIAMAVVGGLGTIIGSLIGSFALYVPSALLLGSGPWGLIVYAVIIAAVLVAVPGGIMSIIMRFIPRRSTARKALTKSQQ